MDIMEFLDYKEFFRSLFFVYFTGFSFGFVEFRICILWRFLWIFRTFCNFGFPVSGFWDSWILSGAIKLVEIWQCNFRQMIRVFIVQKPNLVPNLGLNMTLFHPHDHQHLFIMFVSASKKNQRNLMIKTGKLAKNLKFGQLWT